MVPRLAVGLLLITAAVAACHSSAPYGSPGYAGAAVGVAAAGAIGSRALGGCLAECIGGTHCNAATGLCQSETAPSVGGLGVLGALQAAAASGSASPAGSAIRPPPRVRNVSYPPGHEYEVPASSVSSMSAADAGCDPAHGDGGSLACEMDAATSSY